MGVHKMLWGKGGSVRISGEGRDERRCEKGMEMEIEKEKKWR
jgi:hypothetical protein